MALARRLELGEGDLPPQLDRDEPAGEVGERADRKTAQDGVRQGHAGAQREQRDQREADQSAPAAYAVDARPRARVGLEGDDGDLVLRLGVGLGGLVLLLAHARPAATRSAAR